MTEQHNQPQILEMMHSHYMTHDRLETATEGTSDDLNGHIAGHLAAGWVMAFYSAVPSGGGSLHHFIWRGPKPGTT